MYVTLISRSVIGSSDAFDADSNAPSVFDDIFIWRPSSLPKCALVVGLVMTVLLGTSIGAGLGVGIGSASGSAGSPGEDPLSIDGVHNYDSDHEVRSVAVAAPEDRTNKPPTPPKEKQVVVQFDEEIIVTGAVADDLPPEPGVTAGGDHDYLLADHHDDYDLPVVQTMDGEVATVDGDPDRPVYQVDDEPDLVVLENDTISDELKISRDTGTVVTADGGEPIVVDGDSVTYPEHDTIDLTPNITEVTDVNEGETLSVTATINNSRWAHASEEVELRLYDSGDFYDNETTTVDVNGGEQTEVTLSYDTDSGDYVIDEVEILVDDNRDSQDIEIGAAGAAVIITDTNMPVEGSDLQVTAEVNRYGSIPGGTQNYPISFFVDGQEQQTKVLSLAPGETTTQTFTYETDSEDLPSVETMVKSRTDSSRANVAIVSREDFEDNIEATITNTTVGGLGDKLVVNSTFGYDGEIPDGDTEFGANLTVDGAVQDHRNVSFGVPEPITETFTYERNESDPPISTVMIDTPGEDPSVSFDRDTAIEFTEITDPAARNESLSMEVAVENTGETSGQDTLTVSVSNPAAVESNGMRRHTFQLEPAESITEEFTFNMTDNAPPRLEIRANTSVATESRRVEVRDNVPQFEIENATIHEVSNSDGALSVSSVVRNTGGVTGTQDVRLTFNDESIHTETITLGPDEERTLSTTVYPPADGTYAYGATTDDDSISDTIVAEQAERPEQDGGSSRFALPSLNSLVFPLVVVSLLGVVVVGAAIVKSRASPDDLQELQERMTALQPATRKLQQAARNARNFVSNSGTGSVVVQNGLPRTVLVRVRVRSGDEILFLEDFELTEDEQRTLECLPNTDQFEVGAGVDDIAAHEETFQRGTDEVGVVLQPDGITITTL